MSSSTTTTAAAAAAEEEAPLTYWCHECDMSIHLTLPSASNATPLCPQCHLDFLELMDPTPSTTDTDFLHLDSPTFRATFFHHFNQHLDDHYDLSSSSSSSSSSRSSSSSSSYSLLPTIKIAEGEDNDSSLLPCAVCQDSFALDEEAKKLPCRHLFHPDCILPWLSSGHDSCPLCRFHLTAHNPASELEEEWLSDFEKCFGSSSSSTTTTADSR